MGATTKIIWRGEKDEAESLLAAIIPDDPDDFEAELVGGRGSVELSIIIESDGLGQSRATVDDVLAGLTAAESGFDSIG